MSDLTPNVAFNTFLENEVIDFEKINENFEKLDGYALCIESGEKTALYSGGTSGNATWRYKKYSDGAIEMYTKIELENLKCNSGVSLPYYSPDVKVMLPINMISIDHIETQLASSTIGWISNITDKNIVDYILFKVISTAYESTNIYKQVFINVKGRWK